MCANSASLPDLPPLRNLPQLRIHKRIRKQVSDVLGQSSISAFCFGAHWIEVHEPRLEDRPCDALQRLVHPPVQFDLVVQCAEDVGDGALFGKRGTGIASPRLRCQVTSGATTWRPIGIQDEHETVEESSKDKEAQFLVRTSEFIGRECSLKTRTSRRLIESSTMATFSNGPSAVKERHRRIFDAPSRS